ncbi:MAG: hypothetical protein R3E58_21195 [Phycisphaerae bacterium]
MKWKWEPSAAEPRTLLEVLRGRMRKNGKMPAIIYGHGEKPEPITIDAHEAENLLDHHSRVIELQLNGSKSSFLIKSVQYDYLGTNPIHLDLMRVNVNERIQVNVEIELWDRPRVPKKAVWCRRSSMLSRWNAF